MATSTISSMKSQIDAWEEVTISFPNTASDTQYSKAYVNNVTNEFYFHMYVTFANGLGKGGTICWVPEPKDSSFDFVAVDFITGNCSYMPVYYLNGQIKPRSDIAAGHTIMMLARYLLA